MFSPKAFLSLVQLARVIPSALFSRRKMGKMTGTPITPTAADLLVPLTLTEQLANQAYAGVATLVAGTVTVTAPWVNNNSTKISKIFVQLRTANTVTLTVQYIVLAITDATSFVIQANIAAGTINVADVSTVMWMALP